MQPEPEQPTPLPNMNAGYNTRPTQAFPPRDMVPEVNIPNQFPVQPKPGLDRIDPKKIEQKPLMPPITQSFPNPMMEETKMSKIPSNHSMKKINEGNSKRILIDRLIRYVYQ